MKICTFILTTFVVACMFSCNKSDSSSPNVDGKWYQTEDSTLRTAIVSGITTPTVTYFSKANYYTNGLSINFTNGLICDSIF